VVISNGVINLCADKRRVFSEGMRVLRPGGRLQFADMANGKEIPEGALRLRLRFWSTQTKIVGCGARDRFRVARPRRKPAILHVAGM
jgi:ubiquinone/menaquinone biosynthesis C-methylase UbiE